MKIGIDNALGNAPLALQIRGQRAALLAGNMANADTPGYKARDISFHDLMAQQTGTAGMSKRMELARSHNDHLTGQTGNPLQPEPQYRVPAMPSLDGNTVDVQSEQARFAENSTQFLAALRLLNGRIRSLTSAIKGE